jgi:hypothetical protein
MNRRSRDRLESMHNIIVSSTTIYDPKRRNTLNLHENEKADGVTAINL